MQALWLTAHGSVFVVASVHVDRQAPICFTHRAFLFGINAWSLSRWYESLGAFLVSATKGDSFFFGARLHGEGTQ